MTTPQEIHQTNVQNDDRGGRGDASAFPALFGHENLGPFFPSFLADMSHASPKDQQPRRRRPLSSWCWSEPTARIGVWLTYRRGTYTDTYTHTHGTYVRFLFASADGWSSTSLERETRQDGKRYPLCWLGSPAERFGNVGRPGCGRRRGIGRRTPPRGGGAM